MTASRPSRMFWPTVAVVLPILNLALMIALGASGVHPAGAGVVLGIALLGAELAGLERWQRADDVEKPLSRLVLAGVTIVAVTACAGFGLLIAVMEIACRSGGCS